MIGNIKKVKCYKCTNIAVWIYMPGIGTEDDYYCDSCVSRGCICNSDADDLKLPCSEYEYDSLGFEEESYNT